MQDPNYPSSGTDAEWDAQVAARRHKRRSVIVVVVLVTVAVYLGLLGWHRVDYPTWRIWTLVGLLAVLAAWYGWRGYFRLGSPWLVAALTMFWSLDAATDPRNEEPTLWPAGALFVAIATAIGAFAVSRVAQTLRNAPLRWSRGR